MKNKFSMFAMIAIALFEIVMGGGAAQALLQVK